MEDEKIIQIVSNNKELYALYMGEEDGEYYANTSPVICFALMEYKSGSREIVPMCLMEDGFIDEIGLSCDFKKIVTKPIQCHRAEYDKLKFEMDYERV